MTSLAVLDQLAYKNLTLMVGTPVCQNQVCMIGVSLFEQQYPAILKDNDQY